jgi:putative cell wall-binding protein
MFKKIFITLGLSVCLVGGNFVSVNGLDKIGEIKGSDRYETAGLIAGELAKKEKYTKVILVNSDNTLADGLSASGLSGIENAPILLVKKDKIPKVTLDKLDSVKEIFIIGGLNSVSKDVEDELINKGINVKRINGEDRIKTSLNVAKEIEKTKKVGKVILTNAFKDADAMSVASVAVRDKMPIILTDGKTTEYDTTDKQAYTIGGSNSMSDDIVKTDEVRLGGKDRFETNRMIIKEFYGESKEFYITKAYNLVDALTGSVLAKDTPILLVHNGSNKSVLNDATIKITALGGIDKSILEECLNVTNFVGDEDTGVIEKENNGSNEGNNSGDYDISESGDGTGSGGSGVIWEVVDPEGDWNNQVGK